MEYIYQILIIVICVAIYIFLKKFNSYANKVSNESSINKKLALIEKSEKSINAELSKMEEFDDPEKYKALNDELTSIKKYKIELEEYKKQLDQKNPKDINIKQNKNNNPIHKF